MGSCRDCQFWRGMPEKFPDQFGDCLKSIEPASLMSGHEDMNGDHGIMTAPDFGCVMFEPKD